MSKSIKASLLISLSVLFASPLAIAETDDRALFDQGRVGWSGLKMEATMMLVSMTVELGIERFDREIQDPDLRIPLEGRAVPPGERVVGLDFETDGLGRRNNTKLLLDADSGAALQRTSLDSGKKHKQRVYRFTDVGSYRWTRRPRSSEEDRGPDAWSRLDSEMRHYPSGIAGQTMTEAGGLIYLVSASTLEKTGDFFDILAYSSSNDEVQKVRVEVGSPKRTRVSYRRTGESSKQRVSDKIELIRVRIEGSAFDLGKEEEFELLGLRNVEILIDPETRTPIELSGKVPFFGRVTFELKEMTPIG